MITDAKAIIEISETLDRAAKAVASKIIDQYSKDILGNDQEIDGRETEITPSLGSELTGHLLDEIKKELNGKEVKGVSFKVQVYKQHEENLIGADLLGIVTINFKNRSTTKYYLAQAKIGKRRKKGSIYAANPDILRQANNMLQITPDSFFFLYTKEGIEVVSAFPVELLGQNVINTSNINSKTFSEFYKDFFDCFIGDHRQKIIPFLLSPKRDFHPRDINILYITATIL